MMKFRNQGGWLKTAVFSWLIILSMLLAACGGGAAPADAPADGGDDAASSESADGGDEGGDDGAADDGAAGDMSDEERMEMAQKWMEEEFSPSTISLEEQMTEMEWFIKASAPYRGMDINVVSETIATHSYESQVMAKAFSEIPIWSKYL